MASRKKRPRKQTRARVSTLAAKWLRRLSKLDPEYMSSQLRRDTEELMAICASVLSQDEKRGQK